MANPYQPGPIPQPAPPVPNWPQPGSVPGQPVSGFPAPRPARQRSKADLVAAISLILVTLLYLVCLILAVIQRYDSFLAELSWVLAAISASVAGLLLLLGRRPGTARLLAALGSGVFFTRAVDYLFYPFAPAELVGYGHGSAVSYFGIWPSIPITLLALAALVCLFITAAASAKTGTAVAGPQQPGPQFAPGPTWPQQLSPDSRQPAPNTPGQPAPYSVQPQQQFHPQQPGQFAQPANPSAFAMPQQNTPQQPGQFSPPASPAAFGPPQQQAPQLPGWQQPIPQQPSQYPNPQQPQVQPPTPGQPNTGYDAPPQQPSPYSTPPQGPQQ
ncbi:hypothetical protein K7711_17065 [Nocardia sp. CA2R105]|uniref:hypothetical protein n=1 Tax=Nocardia coffeae TaxID=2873381 RepID=UPI001CA5FCCF|nr:hypothetical protein [Nocardia coffeae]MBY8858195.1 hypothetical protein [Nocardia coffeae]